MSNEIKFEFSVYIYTSLHTDKMELAQNNSKVKYQNFEPDF